MHLHNASCILQRNGVSLEEKNSLKANRAICDKISEKGWQPMALVCSSTGCYYYCSNVKCRTALNNSYFNCRDIYRGLSFALAFLTNGKKGRKKTSLCYCKTPFYSLRLCFEWSTQALNLLFPPAKKRRALSGRIETPCLWHFWSLPLTANSKQMQ